MSPPTILVVEDNPITRKMVRVALAAEGYTVLEAPDGRTALELAASGAPDLIIQDLLLPDMDGFDLVAKLRGLPTEATVPIVAFSGFLSRLEAARTLTSGFSDFLVKPVEPSRLVQTVRSYLPTPGPPPEQPGRERHILVADDDPIQLKLARVHLERLGFRVTTASDGADALERARRSPPDAILSDVLMPGHDGFQLCLAVRQDPSLAGVPVVLCSAHYLDEPDRRLAEQVGASALTVRTPDFSEAIEALLASLGRKPPPAPREPVDVLERERATRALQQLDRQISVNARLLQRVSLQASVLSMLSGLAGSLARPLDMEVAPAELLAVLLDAGGMSIGALYLTGPDGRLHFHAQSGRPYVTTQDAERFFGHPELFRQSLETGQALTIPSAGVPDRTARGFLGRVGAVSAIIAPLTLREERLGALLMAANRRDLTESDWLLFGQTMAGQIAQTIALSRAVSRLAAAEERYRTLFENAVEGIYQASPEGRLLLANPALALMLGYESPEELVAAITDLAQIYVDPDRRREFLRRIAERGVVSGFEVQVRCRDGSVIWASVSARAARDAQGGLRHYEGIVEDITARKLAEEAAVALGQVGRHLTETLDLEEVARRVANAARSLLGAEAAVLYRVEPESGVLVALGASGGAVLSELPPGVGVAGLAAREGRAVTTPDLLADPAIPLTPELRARLERLPSRAVLAVPLSVKGRVIGSLALRDRTGRAFGEDEIRLAQTFADQAALALENARLFAEADRRRREAEELARVARTLTESLDVSAVAERIVETVRSLFAVPSAGFRLLQPDGSLVAVAADASGAHAAQGDVLAPGVGISGPVATRGEPMWCPDLLEDTRFTVDDEIRSRLLATGLRAFLAVPLRAKGRIIGVLSIADGIGREFSQAEVALLQGFADQAALALENARQFAETQRAYQELSRTQAQLTQAQKMDAVGRLAGGVAHDFNNLLTVILGRAEMLLRRLGADDPLGRQVKLIQQTAMKASGLTQQLLAFSRKQVLQPRVLDLNAVVAGMEKMLQRLIGEDVELVTAAGPDLGRVKADPGQLEQVLLNLAVNARDAMPQGGRLTIETRNAELDANYARLHPGAQPGRYVMLAVSDTGVGMDEATRARLFEPFFTTKEPGKGTGLGLATIYGIVKQTGGNIFVYSEPGQGATFKVYLPRVEEAAEPSPVVLGLPEAPRGSETILLVEDEESVRDLAREILEAHGYTVLEARHPAHALLLAERHEGPIHLVITDVVMPGMSGRALAERVAATRPQSRVLYMSGYAGDAIVHHGVLEPGIAFVEKPFTPDTLARKVREVLDA